MTTRILIVEDESDTRDGFADLLEAKGYEAVAAGTLEEARTALEEESPDAVLLDVNLPDGNGLDWVDALRVRHPDLAVVVVTGVGDVPMAVDAMRRGADHFLTKPVRPDNLLVVLERSLEQGGLRRREASRKRQSVSPAVYLGESPAAGKAWELARTAARGGAVVLLQGETGTGKGVMARWIHDNGPRAEASYVELNCSALGGDLLASELFGHKKGAFTSAVSDRAGLIEEADGGTLFLDEIGDMDLAVQARLLKVLEERTYRRVGETRVRRSDFRLICATNHDLAAAVEAGRFRQDLYYRICVFPITVPPLRERREDIPALAAHLLAGHGGDGNLPDEVAERLRRYAWPGNIRELSNILERGLLLAGGAPLEAAHLPGLDAAPASGGAAAPDDWSLDAQEARHLRKAMAHFNGDVTAAAEAIGVSRATLYRKLRKFDIDTGGS